MVKTNRKLKKPNTIKLLIKRFKKNGYKHLTINTLGKKSKISFILKSVPHLFCRNSLGNEFDITAMYETVFEKYLKLKKLRKTVKVGVKAHLMASNYNANKWPQAPDRNFAPYVAALVAFLNNEHR